MMAADWDPEHVPFERPNPGRSSDTPPRRPRTAEPVSAGRTGLEVGGGGRAAGAEERGRGGEDSGSQSGL